MRLKLLLVLLPLVALTGCGGGSSSPPLTNEGSVEAGGWPIGSSTPDGLMLRWVEHGRFGVGVVLRNRGHHEVTVVDARAVVPLGSLVRSVGTRLVPYNPPPCPRHTLGCPIHAFLRGSYGANQPAPVDVAQGKQVGVQLNFRLGGCDAVPLASSAPTDLLAVWYRADGEIHRMTLPLRSAKLHLAKPSAEQCARHPRSSIAVTGPWIGSTDWTIPVSDGDTCATGGGGLRFRSRLFQHGGSNPAMRVTFALPRFRGDGVYRADAARLELILGVGPHGWEHVPASTSVVSVTGNLTGRFRATFAAPHRGRSRASGVWHCTTR